MRVHLRGPAGEGAAPGGGGQTTLTDPLPAVAGCRSRRPRHPCSALTMLKLYTYAKCSTCRRAKAWLQARGAAFAEYPIRETPPTPAELRALLAAYGGQIKRIFNTSGLDYRALNLGPALAGMSPAEALALLAGNGNLVRRPVLLGPGLALAGFDAAAWQAALAGV